MKIGFKAKNFTIDQHRFLNHRWYQEYQQNFWDGELWIGVTNETRQSDIRNSF